MISRPGVGKHISSLSQQIIDQTQLSKNVGSKDNNTSGIETYKDGQDNSLNPIQNADMIYLI